MSAPEPKLMMLAGGEKGLTWLPKLRLRGVMGGDSTWEVVREWERRSESVSSRTNFLGGTSVAEPS